jgi:hypothetical protein
MQRITAAIVTFMMVLGGAFTISMAPALAAGSASKDSACSALDELDSSQGCDSDASKNVVKDLVSTVVNILSLIIGAVAIIMIIVSGFRYVTSGGESSKVAGAKSGLIYAIVGLVVAALAQFIVHFVLNKVG